MIHDLLVEFMRSDLWKQQLDAHLGESARSRLASMSDREVKDVFDFVMDIPINLSLDISYEILSHYYFISWICMFSKLSLPANTLVYEVAAGDTILVPDALAAYSRKKAGYVTSNLNKALSESFKAKAQPLGISVKVIEDNADTIADYYHDDSFDLIVFQHAINDILQTIAADKAGLDTVNSPWREAAPRMIQCLAKYAAEGKLKEAVSEEFLSIIRACCKVLKPGRHMVFNNCIFESDLQRGFPPALYTSLIQLAREWITEGCPGLEVVELEAFDPKWWLVLRKIK